MRTNLLNFVIFVSVMLLSCNQAVKVEEKEHKSTKNEVKQTELNFVEQGKKYVTQTQKVLAANLVNAIKTDGAEHALSFCSSKAYPLTDSMATALNIQIKRVSDKARNPSNKANEEENKYILNSKDLLTKGEAMKPQLVENEEKTIGYYPIVTNQMCMQCHGEANTEVLPKTLEKIQELYPKDEALGYKVNELRGIWVIEMDKK